MKVYKISVQAEFIVEVSFTDWLAVFKRDDETMADAMQRYRRFSAVAKKESMNKLAKALGFDGCKKLDSYGSECRCFAVFFLNFPETVGGTEQ